MAPAGGKIRIRYLLYTFQWHISIRASNLPHVQQGELA
jgi:hypothetical protein